MKKLLFILAFCPLLLNAQIITTVAGTTGYGYSGDGGPAINAKLFGPSGVRVYKGEIYIADQNNNVIRKIDASGIITTIVGTGVGGYSGDSSSAALATLKKPSDIVIDDSGNIYIADFSNSVVRKVSASTGIITTVAGTGAFGYSGDGGPAISAKLQGPSGIDMDREHNLYIADEANEAIRKVSNTGIITTIAGNGTFGYAGDGGPAASAILNSPSGIRLDKAGNIFIADAQNSVIRKINNVGIISTVAGNGTVGYSGDGGPVLSSELNLPLDICVDFAGDLYIGDLHNYVIRKVDKSGIITTFAGTGVSGYNGDGGLATKAQISEPCGVAYDSASNSLYVADFNNSRVRKISNALTIKNIDSKPVGYSIYPNPARFLLNIQTTEQIETINITNIIGQTVFGHIYNNIQRVQFSIQDWPTGIYFLRINNAYVQKLIKE